MTYRIYLLNDMQIDVVLVTVKHEGDDWVFRYGNGEIAALVPASHLRAFRQLVGE